MNTEYCYGNLAWH